MAVEQFTLTGSAITGIAPHLVARGVLDQLPLTVKLGRKPPTKPQIVPHLSAFFDAGNMAAPPPASTNYRAKAANALARMYMNDQLGCCVISSKFHAVGVYSGNDATSALVGTDQEIVSAYHEICGSGDNGCVIDEVLDHWRDKGLRIGGVLHRLDGYVAGDWTNKLQVQAGQFYLGPSSIGFDLPTAWFDSAVWDVTNSSIAGGHDVCVLDYAPEGVYVSSWGRIYLMTWPAFTSRRWLSEYKFQLSPDWYGSDKLAPSGINVAGLKSAMDTIRAGGVPSVDPVPPAPVPPTPPGPTPLPAVHRPWKLQVDGFIVQGASDFAAGVNTGTVTATTSRANPLVPTSDSEAMGIPVGLFIPPALWGLILEYGFKVVPVIVAGILAHKSVSQIIRDVLAVVLAGESP